MTDSEERLELLAALHAAGAASAEDEADLQQLLEADPSLAGVVAEFRDSIVALASSVEPIETSAQTFRSIRRRVREEEGSWLERWLRRRKKRD